jgi:hypothetical protein
MKTTVKVIALFFSVMVISHWFFIWACWQINLVPVAPLVFGADIAIGLLACMAYAAVRDMTDEQ